MGPIALLGKLFAFIASIFSNGTRTVEKLGSAAAEFSDYLSIEAENLRTHAQGDREAAQRKAELIVTKKLADADKWINETKAEIISQSEDSLKTLAKAKAEHPVGAELLDILLAGGSTEDYLKEHPEFIEAQKSAAPAASALDKARAKRKAAKAAAAKQAASSKAASPVGEGANTDDPLADDAADRQAEFFRAQRQAAGK